MVVCMSRYEEYRATKIVHSIMCIYESKKSCVFVYLNIHIYKQVTTQNKNGKIWEREWNGKLCQIDI